MDRQGEGDQTKEDGSSGQVLDLSEAIPSFIECHARRPPRAAFSLCTEHVRQLGREILLAILMEEKVHEAQGPRGGAWAERTVEQTRGAMAGDGIFFYPVPRRIPLEFYRAKRHPFPVSPDTLQSAKDETLAYNDSTYPTFEEMVQKASPAGNRIRLVLSGDREPDGKSNRGSQRLRANYGDAHH